MIRLHFIVEGKTEQTFVRDLLLNHLGVYDIVSDVRKVEFGRSKEKIYRGGLFDYQKLKKDVTFWMKQDQNPDAYFTTMIDLYALPGNFPQYQTTKHLAAYNRVESLEQAFRDDLNHPRFIPYIQLHEFEALLFADITKLSREFLGQYIHNQIKKLSDVLHQFQNNPELINDDPLTAPSKRIIEFIPEYENLKATVGPAVVMNIGIPQLRTQCRHFNDWLTQLEQLK